MMMLWRKYKTRRAWEGVGRGGTLSRRVVQEGLSEEVTFGQSPEGSKEGSHVDVWGKRIPGRVTASAKALRQE